MAKDYFQDIVPPSGDLPPRKLRPTPAQRAVEPETVVEDGSEYTDDDINETDTVAPAPRGIRNVNIQSRARQRPPMADAPRRETPFASRQLPPKPRRKMSKTWLWVLVAVCVLILAFLALFLFRQTKVTVTPRSQSITFNSSAQFTAYPVATAATGTLPYTVDTKTLTDSETVQGNGTTETQMKASGNVTVYNSYSASSVKLVANTRFETPDGLIFRAPDTVVIPGKKGSTPGQIQITVVADQAGPQYNIGPVARFTVPGLQSSPTMYAGVYAVSTGSMTGGFSGNQEGVSASTRQAAVSDIRSKLQQQANQYVQSLSSSSTVVFGSLTEISYTDLPDTDATGSTQVQINESAQVSVPVFNATLFAMQVAQVMGIETNNAPVSLMPGSGYGAQPTDSTPVSLGSQPVDFQLVGSARLVSMVDTEALQQALAGKSAGSFQTIIATFPSIESAQARIEPFWQSSFPSNPTQIKVIVQSSTTTVGSGS